ncbi:hypothetical protein [Ruminococcus sp. Marseille-P6503]|uniref:hypothetical protein n=1 Tax=Ruminococcus sp. Marseille-P6503 TaxID=2364796 RepID=UPI000F54AEE2|nr:hypothetical protein [Ruminococcus sp. Marseille-P6503]
MQDLREIMEFVSSLFKGRQIDIITGGAFKAIFLVLCLAVVLPVGIRKKYRTARILLIILSVFSYLTYFSYTYMPLPLGPADVEYNFDSVNLVLQQMWPPLFDIDFFRDFSLVINIYLKPFALMLAFSFICTVTFRKLRKPAFFAVFAVSAVAFEIVYVLVCNFISGGLKYIYDLTLPFAELFALIVGYLLARLLIYLNRDTVDKIFAAKKTAIKENVI